MWKKFGIILNFTPTVIADGALHLKLAAEVSDVDAARSVTIGGFSIPGLTSRQSETTVRLAGRAELRHRRACSRIGCGRRSSASRSWATSRSWARCSGRSSYQRDESELLVVVTAHLAKPVAPHEAPRLPTEDELNDPNDIQLFLLGS